MIFTLVCSAIAFALLFLDQITKAWAAAENVNQTVISRFLYFRYVKNEGIAFGLFSDNAAAMVFITILTVVMIAAIAVLYFTVFKNHKPARVALAVIEAITRAGETIDEGKPLEIFHPVETWKRMTIENFSLRNLRETWLKGGKRVMPTKPLSEISDYFHSEYARFWEEYTRLDMPHIYKVDLSYELYALKTQMVKSMGKGRK